MLRQRYKFHINIRVGVSIRNVRNLHRSHCYFFFFFLPSFPKRELLAHGATVRHLSVAFPRISRGRSSRDNAFHSWSISIRTAVKAVQRQRSSGERKWRVKKRVLRLPAGHVRVFTVSKPLRTWPRIKRREKITLRTSKPAKRIARFRDERPRTTRASFLTVTVDPDRSATGQYGARKKEQREGNARKWTVIYYEKQLTRVERSEGRSKGNTKSNASPERRNLVPVNKNRRCPMIEETKEIKFQREKERPTEGFTRLLHASWKRKGTMKSNLYVCFPCESMVGRNCGRERRD